MKNLVESIILLRGLINAKEKPDLNEERLNSIINRTFTVLMEIEKILEGGISVTTIKKGNPFEEWVSAH